MKEITEVVADPYSEAMSLALYALAPRAKSRAEHQSQLRKRGVESEVAAAVLDSLELQGLLNDLEFAQLWTESRRRQKKLSASVITQELRGKGVAQDIIDEVMQGTDLDAEYHMAYEMAERKYRSCAHLDHMVIYRRIHSLLARKGFSHQITERIMRELLAS